MKLALLSVALLLLAGCASSNCTSVVNDSGPITYYTADHKECGWVQYQSFDKVWWGEVLANDSMVSSYFTAEADAIDHVEDMCRPLSQFSYKGARK